MGQKVALIKVVRLLGISRHDIQQLVHDGHLSAPDGMVDLEDLRQFFPGLMLQEAAVLERVRLIKTTAFSRRVHSVVTPDFEALEVQIRKRNAELSLERALAKKYKDILDELIRKLGAMQASDDAAQRQVVAELNRWLVDKLEP